MLIFAHIGITFFLATLFLLPALTAVIATLLPDAIDKVLFELGLLPCGRYFGHTIFFGPIATAIVYLITRRKDLALAVLFGLYLHLLLDAKDFLPLFYPLITYPFDCGPLEIGIGWFEIVTESIGLSLIAATIFFKLKIVYLRKKLSAKMRGRQAN